MTVLSAYMGRIGRVSAIFGAASALNLILSLGFTVYTAQHFSPDEFGRLALVLVMSGLLTVLFNLGILQGTNQLVFGHGGDDDGGAVDVGDGERVTDTRRALGTGLCLTLMFALVGIAIVIALAGPLSHLLGSPGQKRLVIAGALSGGLGSLWRLLTNHFRYAQRPASYLLSHISRPFFALIATITMVQTGAGLWGVIAGLAAGTGLAVCFALWLARKDIILHFNRAFAKRIIKRGSPLALVSLSNWAVYSGDVLVVGMLASNADVGLYRLASSVANVGHYGVSAFTMAWGPLRRSPLEAAAERERGVQQAGASLLLGYVLCALGALLAFSALADVLVKLAPHSYSGAARLVPYLVGVPAARGLCLVTYRTGEFANKRRWYLTAASATGVLSIALVLALYHPFGLVGAAVSGAISFAVAAIIMLVRGQRGPAPLPIAWLRLAGGVVVAAACIALDQLLHHNGWQTLPAAAVSIVLYPAILLATGIAPRDGVRTALAAFRAAVVPAVRAGTLARRLRTLSDADVALLDEVIRRRRPLAEIAERLGERELTVRVRTMVLLRQLGDATSGGDSIRGMEYVLHNGAAAEKILIGEKLVHDGVDPLLLDRLNETARALRRLPRQRGPRRRRPPPPPAPAVPSAVSVQRLK